ELLEELGGFGDRLLEVPPDLVQRLRAEFRGRTRRVQGGANLGIEGLRPRRRPFLEPGHSTNRWHSKASAASTEISRPRLSAIRRIAPIPAWDGSGRTCDL